MTPSHLSEQADTSSENADEAYLPGFVYFVETADGQFVKIGFSTRLPKRIAELGTLQPSPFRLHFAGAVPGTKRDERSLHLRFSGTHDNGEWFHKTPELAGLLDRLPIRTQLKPPYGPPERFRFFPSDHEVDMKGLDPAAEGLWIRMLCKMHRAKRRGFLEYPCGRPMGIEEIAFSLSQAVDLVREKLAILEQANIFSRDPLGVIFCRRMVRDTGISLQRRTCGNKGGNPVLLRRPNNEA